MYKPIFAFESCKILSCSQQGPGKIDFYIVRSLPLNEGQLDQCDLCGMGLVEGCVYLAAADAFLDRWCKQCVARTTPNAIPPSFQEAFFSTPCAEHCQVLHLTWDLRST
jgi:hypothetical protein